MSKFIFDGETFDLIRKRFTFGEAAALEKVTGLSMGQLGEAEENPEYQTARLLQGYIWVSIKRKRPTFLFDELEDVGIDDDIEWLEEPSPEPDPGEEAPVGPTSPAPEPEAEPDEKPSQNDD